MPPIRVAVRLEAGGEGDRWTIARFPREVTAQLGTRATVRVVGEANGFPFRSALQPWGDGTHHLMFNKALQAGAKAKAGEEVRFAFAVDPRPRVVRVPPELKALLAGSAKAKSNFEAMPPSHRARYVGYITEAKKPETRQKRAEEAMRHLAKGDGNWRQ